MGSLLERGHLAVAHLVEDSTGLLLTEVVDARALAQTELAQCGRRQLLCEGKRLQTREDTVAAEHRHEPRQSCCRKRVPSGRQWGEPQCGEVDETPPVRRLQRLGVALE